MRVLPLPMCVLLRLWKRMVVTFRQETTRRYDQVDALTPPSLLLSLNEHNNCCRYDQVDGLTPRAEQRYPSTVENWFILP